VIWKLFYYLSVIISVGFIMLATVLIIAQVIFRYVFSMGYIWIPELARYSIIVASLVGAGLVIKEDSHPNVDVLTEFYPEKVREVIDVIFDLIILAFLIFLIIESWDFALNATGDTPALRIPWKYPYFSLVIGFVSMTVFTIKRLLDNIKTIL